MQNSFRVNELDALDDLPEKVPAFGLGERVVLGGDPLEEFSAFEVLCENDALLLALEVVPEEDDVRVVLQPPEDGRFPAGVSLRVGRQPLLMLGRAILATLAVSDQVNFAEAAAAELLNHPVLGAELGQGPIHGLHFCSLVCYVKAEGENAPL